MGEVSVTASNWRLVETGRVALFATGPYEGRLAAIVQIIDHKRVLVEGPSSDKSKVVPRHAAPLSSLGLTSIVITGLPLAIGSGGLKKCWGDQKVEEKYGNSVTAKRAAALKRRKQLNDFERFKVAVLKKQARFEVRKAMASRKGAKA
ncbi:hypothetical protein K470DRAFT_271380 [Piedraia hortae CBS 480.64]|uniref:Large ribosomal subunit protein eL14 domain-containing protein n=1 Tax=Piedraia hortae CBS 480.64 TaxID=1314780 RepID=A0A6A7BYN6_9PEZI|nr:hypothetical protein K470DRAFT_271380 [Piedraia hortae CBS 480.64]